MAQGALKSRKEILRLREIVGLFLDNRRRGEGLTEVLTVADTLDWILGTNEQDLEDRLDTNLESVFMDFAA